MHRSVAFYSFILYCSLLQLFVILEMRLVFLVICFICWSSVECTRPRVIKQFVSHGQLNPESPLKIWTDITGALVPGWAPDQRVWNFDEMEVGQYSSLGDFRGSFEIKPADMHGKKTELCYHYVILTGGVHRRRPLTPSDSDDFSHYGKYISTSSSFKFRLPEPKKFAGFAVTAANKDYEVEVDVNVTGQVTRVRLNRNWVMKNEEYFRFEVYTNLKGQSASSFYVGNSSVGSLKLVASADVPLR